MCLFRADNPAPGDLFMQYYQSRKNWVCYLRRQNLVCWGGLTLYCSAAHLPCVLQQQELHHLCLNSGLYGVCTGSHLMLPLSPRLISTPSAIPTSPPSRKMSKCSHTSGCDTRSCSGEPLCRRDPPWEMGLTGDPSQRQTNAIVLPPLQNA